MTQQCSKDLDVTSMDLKLQDADESIRFLKMKVQSLESNLMLCKNNMQSDDMVHKVALSID